MKIPPRYFAAVQFTVVGAFSVAVWVLMLSPVERSLAQIEFIFSPSNEHREFFVWFAVATLFTIAIAASYWFKQSTIRPMASLLVLGSALLFALSVWQFGSTFIFGYGLGLFFAVGSWGRPNPVSSGTPRKQHILSFKR
ncbi:MAG: hypothetical protein JNM52_11925 [Betaproteobacteria bacterium]|nr:hypothetical protein [Betaproteobacteria bacterium]